MKASDARKITNEYYSFETLVSIIKRNASAGCEEIEVDFEKFNRFSTDLNNLGYKLSVHRRNAKGEPATFTIKW